ncbi:hypothetical protein OROGR_002314 [Orobanche gracilis]
MAAGLTTVVAIPAVVTSGGFEIRILPLNRRVPMAACDLPRRLVLYFRSGDEEKIRSDILTFAEEGRWRKEKLQELDLLDRSIGIRASKSKPP